MSKFLLAAGGSLGLGLLILIAFVWRSRGKAERLALEQLQKARKAAVNKALKDIGAKTKEAEQLAKEQAEKEVEELREALQDAREEPDRRKRRARLKEVAEAARKRADMLLKQAEEDRKHG